MSHLDSKLRSLQETIADMESVLVAFSGGVDSTYLLSVCLDVLGTAAVLAITEDSPMIPRDELAEAVDLAHRLGARHMVLACDSLMDPAVASNPPDRCYHCKAGLFRSLRELAATEGIATILHGENADDIGDYRPGSRAAVELGVRAPLQEAGLTKDEIRELSRRSGLPTWDQPARPCLASRIPYGTPITYEALARVEAAEAALRRCWGPLPLRVRDHYPMARIEVPAEHLARLAGPEARTAAVEALRSLGYLYVTLDLAGYRMGSLNEPLIAPAGGSDEGD